MTGEKMARVIQNEDALSHGYGHYFLELNGVQVLDGPDDIELQRIADAANTWAASLVEEAVKDHDGVWKARLAEAQAEISDLVDLHLKPESEGANRAKDRLEDGHPVQYLLAHVMEAVKKEREECAKVVDSFGDKKMTDRPSQEMTAVGLCDAISSAICARTGGGK